MAPDKPSPILDLLRRGTVYVTGKGGTGKTTLAVALARLGAAQGRKVVLVEVDNHRPSLTEHLGTVPTFEPVLVAPNLAISNITWPEALADWLTGVVPASRIVKLILSNRMVRLFLDVTPGSREMVIFARILALARQYDLVVVDLPASGHAVSFFLVPHRALLVFLTGPIRKLASDIVESLRSGGSEILLVTLPEEMVVNETVETWAALGSLAPELQPRTVFLNQGLEPSLSPDERVLLDRLVARGLSPQVPPSRQEGAQDPLAQLVLAGLWEADREQATAQARERLVRETGVRVLTVPLMGQGEGPADLSRRVEGLLRRGLFEGARP